MAVGQARIRLVLSRLLALQGSNQSVVISQKQLASDLGLAVPVISMAMTALKKAGRARKNADRSWSVSETPIYDNRDRIDVLLAEVRQLQEKVSGLGRIDLPAGPPTAGAGRPQPAAGQAWPAAKERPHLEHVTGHPRRETLGNEAPEMAGPVGVFACVGRPRPTGRLHIWHDPDSKYPFRVFIADAFAYDARGVVFALRICGTGDDAEPYPVRRGYEPREGDRGDAFIETVDGLADFKTAADLRGGFAARISNAPAGAKLDWTSWLVFVKT